MSLQQRLSLSIFAVLLLFCLNVAIYFWGSHIRSEGLNVLRSAVANQKSTVLLTQQVEKQQKEILVLDVLRVTGEEQLSDTDIGKSLVAIRELHQGLLILEGKTLTGTTSLEADKITEDVDKLIVEWRKFFNSLKSRNRQQDALNGNVMSASNDLKEAYKNTREHLDTIESHEMQRAETQTKKIENTLRVTDRITIFVFLVSIFLTSSLGFILIRFTNRSLSLLTEGTQQFGKGNLNYQIPIVSDDELGDLANAFNDMALNLRNALQEAKKLQEKADQANQAKSSFLANMSHEFRTPMNTIIGYSEMIIEEIAEDEKIIAKQITPDVENILIAGKHLLALLNDVLDLSKIESGKMSLYIENFDSLAILNEVITTITPLAKATHNKMIVLAKLKDPIVNSDMTKYRQIFFNLLSNACKFTHDGLITITLENFSNEFEPWLRIMVTDTGIGMTDEQCEVIFDEFVQADSSTTKEYGGTGLGLAICLQFCELMGGAIGVTSELGEGTTFTVELPVDTAKVERAKESIQEPVEN